jgi:GLPGLI family protein
MKKIFVSATLIATTLIATAQQQGKVTYDRTVKLQMSFVGMGGGGMEHQVPTSRTDKYELSYTGNQTLWKQAEQEENGDDGTFTTENGGQIRMIVAGSNDVMYTNLETGKKVEKREMFDKTFIVDDTIAKMKWKMAGETKEILGHKCMKATSIRISKRMIMNEENGVIERKEIEDTSTVVAWFAMDIPVSAGPSEFQGQLPGLILEMDIKDGTQIYRATAISDVVKADEIKEPTGKKRYTPAEFKTEREKMMKEMQESMPGGPGNRRVIRMN